jgi:DNA helicase HerA-like ATPase
VAESDKNSTLVNESADLITTSKDGKYFIIADLTDPLLSKEEANGLFQVLTEQFRTLPTKGAKVLFLDEAHKYMRGVQSDGLSEAIVNVARLMRHDGMRLIVSTQSPKALAPELLELVTVGCLHHFHSPDWWDILKVCALNETRLCLFRNFLQDYDDL